MKATFKRTLINSAGEFEVTIATTDKVAVEAVNSLANDIIEVSIDKWHAKRSLNANSYFHVLVGKLAKYHNVSETEMKRSLVLDWGTAAILPNGDQFKVMMSREANILDFYPYAKWDMDGISEKGINVSCYILYKHTHELNRAEMARLINGAVSEALDAGIETMTPAEIKRLEDMWGKGDNE